MVTTLLKMDDTMNISQNINITTTQKLTISPQLQHAIKLLQMSNIELSEKIENEISENPFLDEVIREEKPQLPDLDDPDGDSNAKRNNNDEKTTPIKGDLKKDRKENYNQDSYEDSFDDSSDIGYQKSSYESRNPENDRQSILEGTISTTETIYDHLMSQLRLAKKDGKDLLGLDFEIGEMLITSLDHNGMLKVPLDEIAKDAETTVDHVESILTVIQGFDPAGIAGRSTEETLLLQVQRDEAPHPLAEEIIRDHLRLLENKKHRELVSKLGVTPEEVREAEKYISSLEPYPARQFDTGKVKYIIPDIFVKRNDDESFDIIINDEFIPQIQLNTKYRKVSKNETNKEVKEFLDTKYSEAKLLIFSLDKRRDTIYRVVSKLVELQEDFFIHGPQHLKPLILRDVASVLDMHESTISRVTTDKYISTPWGTFELKYFFSSGIRKTSGELKSSTSIKEIIRQIIEKEAGDKTLSDQKIVEILKKMGIKIARRTVAKYRNSLQIVPSYQRKKI